MAVAEERDEGHRDVVVLERRSALGHVAPPAFMAGQAPAIWAARDRKVEAAREQQQERRHE